MAIPLTLLNRLAIPLVVAALYLYKGSRDGVNVARQAILFDKTMRISDQVLSEAKGELGGGSPEENTFDYVVIGGGAAGAVLVNRLTATGNRVMVLEAGGDPNPLLDIPFAYRPVFWGTRIMDWNYTTIQQKTSCLRNFNGYCDWPRGKCLGGTSGINVGLYNRGLPKDFDLWANFTGDDSWSWKSLRGIYNRLEDYHGWHEDSVTNETHGQGGDIFVGKVDYLPGLPVLKEALKEKGFPVGDLDGGEFHRGFGTVDYSIKQGVRWGAYRSHLEPVLGRPTLFVRRYATATKILFDNLRAVGVEYERHGVSGLRVFARKEVILCGGAMESPKLLLLSGIGSRAHLESLQIIPLVDLPAVGQHLQDHPGVDIVGGDGIGFLLNSTFGTPIRNPQWILQYLENGTGPMNSYSKTVRLMKGNLNSHLNSDPEWPEVYIFVYTHFHEDPPQDEINFTVQLLRSSTQGSVKLAQADPSVKPLIDPNFFEDPTDVERIIDGIELMLNLFINSTAYQRHGVSMFSPLESCVKDSTPFLSRDYWKCYIYQMTTPRFHSTSTCRMGPNQTVAVVDSQLRVFGTEALRVVDASVIPFVPSGNTYMPTMLVAEMGAQLILKDSQENTKKPIYY